MYIVAFAITFFLVLHRIKREDRFEVTTDQIKDLTTYMIVGLVIGARLGYVLFYNPSYYLEHPLEIVLHFSFSKNGVSFTGISGMSYHGGLMGTILAAWLYVRKAGLEWWDMADLYLPVIPLGYTFGRLGNFINGAPASLSIVRSLFRRDFSVRDSVVHSQGRPSQRRHAGPLPDRIRHGKVFHRVLPAARCPPRLCSSILFHGADLVCFNDCGWNCSVCLPSQTGHSLK
jgi:hypothetical protein